MIFKMAARGRHWNMQKKYSTNRGVVFTCDTLELIFAFVLTFFVKTIWDESYLIV